MKRSALVAMIGMALAGAAHAQSPDYMQEDCAVAAQGFFQAFDATTEVKYEGQRTDGTHAVNGTIAFDTRSEDFQCSYNATGDSMVDFYAEGKSWPDFAQTGEGSPYFSN